MTTASVSPVTISAAGFHDAIDPAFTRGAVGGPRALLRLEGAAMFGAACVAYAQLGGSWLWFAALFLGPDLSLLGYLAGPRAGAASYNAAHSYLAPALLATLALLFGAHSLWLAAAISAAHIGFDRMLGYGLKYATAFGDTHLGRVGFAQKTH